MLTADSAGTVSPTHNPYLALVLQSQDYKTQSEAYKLGFLLCMSAASGSPLEQYITKALSPTETAGQVYRDPKMQDIK